MGPDVPCHCFQIHCKLSNFPEATPVGTMCHACHASWVADYRSTQILHPSLSHRTMCPCGYNPPPLLHHVDTQVQFLLSHPWEHASMISPSPPHTQKCAFVVMTPLLHKVCPPWAHSLCHSPHCTALLKQRQEVASREGSLCFSQNDGGVAARQEPWGLQLNPLAQGPLVGLPWYYWNASV